MVKYAFRLVAAVLLLLAPALSSAATGGYRIQPGDTLQLEVLQDSSLNRQLLVLPDGSITVPLAGSVKAAGLTVDALRAEVTTALASNFSTKPTVYLSVATIPRPDTTATGPTITVYVMGQVAKAGPAKVPVGTTLLQALAFGGGLTDFAATKRIELLRQDSSGQQRAYLYNYKAMLAGASTPVIVLKPGDVIVVPQRRLFE